MFRNPETKYELKAFRIKVSQPKKVIFVWMDLFRPCLDFPWGVTSQMVKYSRRKMPKMEQFLTYAVRCLCREGKTPCFEFGGQWRFDRFEIDVAYK